MRLTAKSVEAAHAADVRREIGDDYMRGLYLVIQPHTGTKSWAVRYRLHGKPTKHTIGSYPAFNLGQAREAAAKVLRGVSEGRGPEATKIETIAQGVEQFIARHCKHYRPKSLREATTQLARYVVEPWGARRLGSINRSDVRHMLDGISAPILANRVHSVVSTFFKWCVENDLISISPAAGIRRPHKEKSRDRVLTDSELGQAWRSANGFYGQIVRLLILTGQRRGEVSGMCWNELDLDQATWTLPPERTKNGRRHEIPLSKQALAIIRGLPRISEHYVFSVDGVRPYRGRQVRAGGTDWVVHDLRRSVATGLQRLGVRLEVTEAVLNHVSGSRGGIVGVYQKHKYTDEKRRALQQWADYVEAMIRR